MKKFAQLLSASVYVLATSCGSQTLPEGMFSIGKFELGKTTTSDVQTYFGPSEFRPLELGDGPDRGACYSNGNTAFSPTIVFETGALGGWTEITAYRLTKRHKRKCEPTVISIAKLSTGNGLHLLSDRRAATKALNTPPSKSPITIRVEQAYQRKATPEEVNRIRKAYPDATHFAYDVVDTIELRFKNNVVDDLYVKRLVSY
jgi:hypothetical protein